MSRNLRRAVSGVLRLLKIHAGTAWGVFSGEAASLVSYRIVFQIPWAYIEHEE